MTWFQWLAIVPAGGAAARELILLMRGIGRRPGRLFRFVLWVATALAIRFPQAVQSAATMVGIRRGADLVLYLFVLVFLVTALYLYARVERLQRRMTTLVRELALERARHRGAGDPGEPGDGSV